MSVRLTPEQMDLLAADVARSSDRWVRDRVLSLLAEVRERRAEDGAARLVCEGYTAAHRDRDAWKTRANEFEAQVEMLEARGEVDLLNVEAASARATQAESQAAAMLGALEDLSDGACDAPGYSSGCDMRCKGVACRAIDTYEAAGRTLLAELEALREVVVNYRDIEKTIGQVLGDNDFVMEAVCRIDAALAAVDAARKGE